MPAIYRNDGFSVGSNYALNLIGNPVRMNGVPIRIVQVDMNLKRTYTITCSDGFPTFLLYGLGTEPIGYIFAGRSLNTSNPGVSVYRFGNTSETITFSAQTGKIILKMPGDYKQFTITSTHNFNGAIS